MALKLTCDFDECQTAYKIRLSSGSTTSGLRKNPQMKREPSAACLVGNYAPKITSTFMAAIKNDVDVCSWPNELFAVAHYLLYYALKYKIA